MKDIISISLQILTLLLLVLVSIQFVNVSSRLVNEIDSISTKVSSFNSDVVDRLNEMKYDKPQFNVMHGFYVDKKDPKGNGFRMIRVDKAGYVILSRKRAK